MTIHGITKPSTETSGDLQATETAGIAHQRKVWSKRADQWHHGSVTGLDKVIAVVMREANPTADAVAVDLGCGTGELTLPLAARAGHVTAVDISPRMDEVLRAKVSAARIANVESVVSPIELVSFEAQSTDLVVSNYALHHLRDCDKRALVAKAARWLRPGGRLVIGDMMFGRGADAHDWAVAKVKVRALGHMGPGGWWRIVKNVWRYLWRSQERPISTSAWTSILRDAGFDDVTTFVVLNEAAVVVGTVPLR